MIETAILGLLTEGDAHGYGLHRRLIDMGFWRVSFGSVYPALRRLKAVGAVEVSETKDEKGRKQYRLTESGRELLISQLGDMETVDNTSGFRVRMTFLDLLSGQDRVAVLAKRAEILKERISAARASVAENARSAYARSEIEHRAASMQRDVEWVEGLIMQETKGTS